jgi:AraC-like DNA-binding protein
MSEPFTFVDRPRQHSHTREDSWTVESQGAFGPRMAEYLAGQNHDALELEWFSHSKLVATRLQYFKGLSTLSAPIPSEKAYIIAVQLSPLSFHQLWLRGALAQTGCLAEGAVDVVDLEQEPRFFLPTPFHTLQFYITRETVDKLADEFDVQSVGGLSWPYGAVDETLLHLSCALIKLLRACEHKAFVDQFVKIFILHLLMAYGGARMRSAIARGGLASWQLRRCRERANGSLATSISLDELAKECRLSTGYFGAAFKTSTGETPHRWLLKLRIKEAKKLLATTDLPISEIAPACGFSDQSHLTKAFSTIAGLTPGAWRREQQVNA